MTVVVKTQCNGPESAFRLYEYLNAQAINSTLTMSWVIGSSEPTQVSITFYNTGLQKVGDTILFLYKNKFILTLPPLEG